MFDKESRYYRVGEYVARDIRGNFNKVKKTRRVDKRSDKAFTYIVKDGDRLDLLAYKFYNDPTKYWLICDANRSIFPSDLMVTGKTITIPKEETL